MKMKKTKGTTKCFIKRKLKFQDHKNCLEVAQIENKINHIEKNKIDVDSLKKYQKESIKIINKTALSSDDDKRMQSTDSTETYAYRMNKNLLCKEEEIKCDNILKQYKHVFFKIKEHNPN